MKVIITSLAVLSMVAAAVAADNAPAPPAGSAKFSQLVGTWSGEGQNQDAGKPATRVHLTGDCKPASGGWAVRCDFSMTSPGMNYLEADLFGYDAVTGKVHWYAISNAGEVHDHTGSWIDDSRFSVRYVGENAMIESVQMTFNGKNTVSFEADTDVAGKRTNTLTGSMTRR